MLGDRALSAITAGRIGSWYAATLVSRPTLRARTYSLLRTILTWAVEDGLLASDPVPDPRGRLVEASHTHDGGHTGAGR